MPHRHALRPPARSSFRVSSAISAVPQASPASGLTSATPSFAAAGRTVRRGAADPGVFDPLLCGGAGDSPKPLWLRPLHHSGGTRRAAGDRHPQPVTAAASQVTTKPPGRRTRRDSATNREKTPLLGGRRTIPEQLSGPGAATIRQEHAFHESLVSSSVIFAEVPFAGLSVSV
jgi:hypothetical protein